MKTNEAIKLDLTSIYFDDNRWTISVRYCIDALLALFILMLSSPLFILLALLIKFDDGGSIFYRGVRYGYGKKLFTIYKFRTLVPNAEKIIGARVLQSGEGLETRLGKFMRDTRIDELPQLFNILNGSMAFIGPRPERPAIYAKLCRDIKGYDKRFAVKPGIFGYSQLFTPHGTSRRMRAYIDNNYSCRDNRVKDVHFIINAFVILGVALVKRFFKVTHAKTKMLVSVYRLKNLRRFERKHHNPKKVNIEIWHTYDYLPKIDHRIRLHRPHVNPLLVNINEEALLVRSQQPIFLSEHKNPILKITLRKSGLLGRKKFKSAYCRLTEVIYLNNDSYLLKYQSISSLNQYKVEKYFLGKSII